MMETKKEAWSYCSIYLGLWQKHVTFFLQAFWSKKDTNCNRILSCWEFRQENMSSNYMHMQLNAAAAKYVQSYVKIHINTQYEVNIGNFYRLTCITISNHDAHNSKVGTYSRIESICFWVIGSGIFLMFKSCQALYIDSN